ncbi:hypothetical protein MTO96_001150 [Rhipicephalus appendiculatus]
MSRKRGNVDDIESKDSQRSFGKHSRPSNTVSVDWRGNEKRDEQCADGRPYTTAGRRQGAEHCALKRASRVTLWPQHIGDRPPAEAAHDVNDRRNRDGTGRFFMLPLFGEEFARAWPAARDPVDVIS